MRSLRDPWTLGGLTIPNRVVLAPLAGIGNWFVRLQAKRYGAGLAVSEMVSSFAVHYGNRKTLDELLTIHPDERGRRAGVHPAVRPRPGDHALAPPRRSRARAPTSSTSTWAARCRRSARPAPAPRCSATPTRRSRSRAPRARAPGCRSPSSCARGRKPGESDGVELAHRLVDEAGVAGISFHPRSAAVHHKGTPDYDLAKELVASLPVPVILSGGLDAPDHIRWVLEHTGAAAVMLARGVARQPVAVRAAARRAARRADAARRSSTSSTGSSSARSSTSARSARRATCASSTPGTVAARRAALDARPRCSANASSRSSARSCCTCATMLRRSRPEPPEPASVKDAAPMPKDVILTPEGLEKLKEELEHLSTDEAPRGRRAHQGGSRVRRHLRELRVRRRQERAGHARGAHRHARGASCAPRRSIDATDLDNDVVRVGSLVNVKDEKSGKSLKYTIVGSTEANPAENKLSNESPVGNALLGHKRNDERHRPAAQRQGRASSRSRRSTSPEAVSDEPSELLATRRREARGAARRRHRPVPARVPRGRADRRRQARPTRASRPATETDDRDRVAGRLPRAAARARWRSSTSSTAAAASSCRRASTCSARSRSSACSSLDLGDLIGVDGTVFAPRRGELSLRVEDWTLLAKSLRPPPEKYHGLPTSRRASAAASST